MAKTVQHKPGDDSIAEVEPKKHGDVWMIRWRWWPYDGSKSVPHRHQGKTKGEARESPRQGGRAASRPGRNGAMDQGEQAERLHRRRLAPGDREIDPTGRVLEAGVLPSEHQRPGRRNHDQRSQQPRHRRPDHRGHRGQARRRIRAHRPKRVEPLGLRARSRIIAQSPLFGADIEYGEVKTTAKPANDVALQRGRLRPPADPPPRDRPVDRTPQATQPRHRPTSGKPSST